MSISRRLPRLVVLVVMSSSSVVVRRGGRLRLNSICTSALVDVGVGDPASRPVDVEVDAALGVVVGVADPAGDVDPSASVTLTRRSALRRQWRGSVSGRSTPREVTSSV